MSEHQDGDALVFEVDPVSNGKSRKVTARLNKQAVYIDTLDLTKNTARQKFIKALVAKVPQAKDQDIDGLLLKMADESTAPPASTSGPVEMDVSRIVRPEQFHTPEVSGLAIPVVRLVEGKPAARWTLYLRWADGRRECRELTAHIDLPDGLRLWIHPVPGEPSMMQVAGWSVTSRQAWVDGAEAPNAASLFKRVCERIAYFIDLPPDVAPGTTATLMLWVLLTYVFQAWPAVPYLFIGGPLGSGKSRVFEILARLVFRHLGSSSLTGPSLFRTLHDRGGTLLYDEAERLRQSTPEVTELLAMLLAGYKRGGQATRLEAVGDSFRSVSFDVFGPKALACIAGLPPTLASRCIPIMMFRAPPDSPKPKRRIDEDPHAWQELRDQLHALALEHGADWMELVQRSNVCCTGIDGRAYELWQPLLALASWMESHGADGLLALVQDHAKESIDVAKDDAVPEADEMLLEILAENARDGQWPTPGEILKTAQCRDPGTFGKADGPGPRWHPTTVSRRLKTYGIPTPRKSNGERRYRDVTLAMLRRVQRSYGIALDIPDPDSIGPTLTDPSAPGPAVVKGNARVGQGQ